jgi:hypothetical protein
MKPHFYGMTSFSFRYGKNYSENSGPQVHRFPSSLKNLLKYLHQFRPSYGLEWREIT